MRQRDGNCTCKSCFEFASLPVAGPSGTNRPVVEREVHRVCPPGVVRWDPVVLPHWSASTHTFVNSPLNHSRGQSQFYSGSLPPSLIHSFIHSLTCMGVLPAFMSVYQCISSAKETLELEIQMVVGCHVNLGN